MSNKANENIQLNSTTKIMQLRVKPLRACVMKYVTGAGREKHLVEKSYNKQEYKYTAVAAKYIKSMFSYLNCFLISILIKKHVRKINITLTILTTILT